MSMNILEVASKLPIRGVFEGIDRNEYFRTPGLNPSTIVKRRKSALAAKHAYESESGDTEAKLFGRCCHSLLFEPHRFNDDWAVWPDKDKRGSEWKEFKAQADAEGKEIIKAGDGMYRLDRAVAATQAAIRKPRVKDLIAEGIAEVALFTGELGMQCKGRTDWIDTRGGNLVDAKFTNDITPSVFGRSAASFGYRIKMALYREWFQRESGKEINGVYLILVEPEPPYDVAVVPITEDQLEDGLAQARELLAKMANNIALNWWPGVDEGQDEIPLEVPYWDLLESNAVIEFAGADEIEVE